MRRLHERIQSVDICIVDRIQRQVVFPVLFSRVFGHITQQTVVFVRRELRKADTHLPLPFVAVFRKLDKEHPRTRCRMFQSVLDGEAVRSLALLNKAIVGSEDVCAVSSENPVDLRRNGVSQHATFQTLVPMLRFDPALGINLRRPAGGRDTGIDRRCALLREFRLLAEEDHAECRAFHNAAWVESVKRMQHRDYWTQNDVIQRIGRKS